MKTLIALSVLSVVASSAAPVLYSSNFGNNTVTAYDLATGTLIGTPVTAGLELSGLNGMRRDSAGDFIVTGQDTNNIVRYNSSGALMSVFDPANLAGLSSPQDLTFGPDGKLYVASAGSDRIVRYDPATGVFTDTFADVSGMGHAGPIGVAFGPDGNLYVSTFDLAGSFRSTARRAPSSILRPVPLVWAWSRSLRTGWQFLCGRPQPEYLRRQHLSLHAWYTFARVVHSGRCRRPGQPWRSCVR